MASTERRKSPRSKTQLLTAYRCLDQDQVTSTGFGRALNLSVIGALVESPDPFPVGQMLSLEFLLDNDQLAILHGRVTRIIKNKALYQAAVEFVKPPARARRLIALQTGKPLAAPAKKSVKTPAKKSARKPVKRKTPK
ncbi:MAG: PilZ domain-containing protein [Chloroflexi bacterium]|nr:PilZ domain-containing protein [Chloroflexota bacterium]